MGERVTESGFYNGKFVKSGQGKPEVEGKPEAKASDDKHKAKAKD
ncbi:hypothetical protein [Paracoccus sp. 22332]